MSSVFGRINCDSPHYTELEVESPFFIRRYKSLVCASVTLPEEDYFKAFSILFRYIACEKAKIFEEEDTNKPTKISLNAPIIVYDSKTWGESTANSEEDSFKTFANSNYISSSRSSSTLTSSSDDSFFLRRPSIKVKTAPLNEKKPQFEVRLENYELPPTPPSPKDTRQAEKFDTMRFIMPANFRRVESLPKPKDERIQLVKLEERVLAGIRFNGRVKGSSSQLYWKQRQKLEDWVDGLDRWRREVEGDVEFASYNPPWTLGKFRTNEILIPLQSRQVFF